MNKIQYQLVIIKIVTVCHRVTLASPIRVNVGRDHYVVMGIDRYGNLSLSLYSDICTLSHYINIFNVENSKIMANRVVEITQYHERYCRE